MGAKKSAERGFVPWAVFTDPPIASVGLRTQDMQPGMKEGLFPLAASSRAFIDNERTGWVKVITSSEGTILGGTIVGPNAPELITILSLAVEKKLSMRDLSRNHFFHPSIAESIFCAMQDSQKLCIELPRNAQRAKEGK
jgi:dihydrolipoamide dehydrogenase